MHAIDRDNIPALFISKSGAAEVGLKLIAKLPREVREISVSASTHPAPPKTVPVTPRMLRQITREIIKSKIH